MSPYSQASEGRWSSSKCCSIWGWVKWGWRGTLQGCWNNEGTLPLCSCQRGGMKLH